MIKIYSRGMAILSTLAVVSALMLMGPRPAQAEPCCEGYGDNFRPDLFYNNYAPQASCGGQPVSMYPAPHPTPPLVGHTYYTYQPLLPHEFLYPHRRVYHRYYNQNMGLTRTTIVWHKDPIESIWETVVHTFRPAR